MTERPQLSIVDGGKGASDKDPAQPAMPTSLENRLAADLRTQRELNAELTLELGANHAAVGLAARRQEDLLTQLQAEREARRRVEMLLRERDSDVRLLTGKLGFAERSAEASQEESRALAAKLETGNTRSAVLLERLSEVEAELKVIVPRLAEFKTMVRDRDARLLAAHDELAGQAASRHDLGERLALALEARDAAVATAQASTETNVQLAAQVRAFVLRLSESLGSDGGMIAAAETSALPVVGNALAAILAKATDCIARLRAEWHSAQTVAAALENEKAAMSAELADLAVRYDEMTSKAGVRYDRLTRQAAELAVLREAVAHGEQQAISAAALLKDRDAALHLLKQESTRILSDFARMKSRVSQLETQLAQADARLATISAESRKREASLQAELSTLAETFRASAQHAESAERDNARLVESEQALRTELSQLNTLLDERRQIIRQLQQERALIKLGRKRALPDA